MSQVFINNATGTIITATLNGGAGPEAFIGLSTAVAGEGANSFVPSLPLDVPEVPGDFFTATLITLDGTQTEIIKVVEIVSGATAVFKGYRNIYGVAIANIGDFVGGTMEVRLIAEDITCMNDAISNILVDGGGNILVDANGNVLTAAC